MGRSIIFQYGGAFRTIGEDLHTMSLQEGDINEGVKALQFKGLVHKYLDFYPSSNQRMSSPHHCSLIFVLSVDLFIFTNFQGHHVWKLGRIERTHSSCPVTN